MALINDIEATTQWQSVNALSGVAVGTAINLQHKSFQNEVVFLCEGAQPSADSRDGRMLTEDARDASYQAGSQELWIRASDDSCFVHVEEA